MHIFFGQNNRCDNPDNSVGVILNADEAVCLHNCFIMLTDAREVLKAFPGAYESLLQLVTTTDNAETDCLDKAVDTILRPLGDALFLNYADELVEETAVPYGADVADDSSYRNAVRR